MFTCISCRVAFDTAAEQRSHFSTDWHRYNMKRRVASLPPVAAAAFNEKVIERREQNAVRADPRGMSCSACGKTFSTENAYRSHIQSKKHRDREHIHEQRLAHTSEHIHPEYIAQTEVTGSQGPSNSSIRSQSPRHSADENGSSHEESAGEEDDGHGIEAKLESSRRRNFQVSDCLFCLAKTSSIDAAIQHMSRQHSFFIPDQEYLVDVSGLLGYLAEKIIVGNLCIKCPNGGREFGGLEAVRKHMIDKGHCKIAFETDEDRAELSDYYAFEVEAGEWEDVDDDGVEGLETDPTHQASLPSIGQDGLSLHLPSGLVLGHRSLRVYYAQRFRQAPANDNRALISAKLALVKERLADPTQALVPVAGGSGSYGRGLQLVRARNTGEARWARHQSRSFRDQKTKLQHQIIAGYRNNNQKHFRDPLLQ